MYINLRKLIFLLIVFFLTPINYVSADTINLKEVLEIIQKDLRTLERAVYSESFSNSNNSTSNQNSLNEDKEDVLTRHLLKLSEIEKQFQDLTNRYEEINFKLDKLSSRLSKVQADNQLRFQQIENNSIINDSENKSITTLPKNETNEKKILPGSSQPQDLGTVSYKDMTDDSENQAIQSVDTTKTVVTEVFQSEEKILPDVTPEEQYEFATSFLKVGDYNMGRKSI